MNKILFKYEPDYITTAGEILEEILLARGIQKVDLAYRCGLSAKQMSLIINGRAPITAETAIRFERALGISASIWNNLEAKFRLHQARKQDREELKKHRDWLQRFPLRDLERRGITKKDSSLAEQVSQLLDFFGVGSVESWEKQYKRLQVAFRRCVAFKSHRESVVTWLRMGELKAAEADYAAYDKSKFDAALDQIRKLSCEKPKIFKPKMKRLCADSGVALVFVRELAGTHLSGATRWLGHNKAMIAISLRYKTDDQLWFTFFHEAGHLKLHGKKEIFIDEHSHSESNREEEEANRFAANRLIPIRAYDDFKRGGEYTESNICKFAETLKIAPGIVVGRLQHDGLLPWDTSLNSLKCRFRLIETNKK